MLLSRTYTPFYIDPDWRVSAEGLFAVRLISNVLFMVLSLDCGISEKLLKFASVQYVGLWHNEQDCKRLNCLILILVALMNLGD